MAVKQYGKKLGQAHEQSSKGEYAQELYGKGLLSRGEVADDEPH